MESKRLIAMKVLEKGGDTFTQNEIIHDTELSQQLVAYHMNNLRDAGYINKEPGKRGRYRVYKESELLAYIIDLKDKGAERSVKPTNIEVWLQKKIIHKLEISRHLRNLQMPGNEVYHDSCMENLDSITEDIQQLKRWYRTSNPDKGDSRDALLKAEEDVETSWYSQSTMLKNIMGSHQWAEFIDKQKQLRVGKFNG